MSSCVCATGHIKDPVPLIEKSRALCPSGRFPPNLIHQVIIISGLNKLYNCSRPEEGLGCRQGVKPPLRLKCLFEIYPLHPLDISLRIQLAMAWLSNRGPHQQKQMLLKGHVIKFQ